MKTHLVQERRGSEELENGGCKINNEGSYGLDWMDIWNREEAN